MSRHEGVSCDSCLKTNFRCRRYKCLICYDYDLCANCYEEGVTNTRHLSEHPMQCILTRTDFELYYGGEVLGSDQPQSFTCPFCKKMGFSDSALSEHVNAEHTDMGYEIVCPVCAAMPGGDPNLVTDDFAGHLTIEHRTGNRDLISFLDEPSAIRHGGVRRIPHSGRPINGPRPRRTNSGLPVIYPVGRDPTAEILFQLSGGRLGAPPPSQLQQLQNQIQLERQQVSAARQQLERLPRLPTVYTSLISGGTSTTTGTTVSTAAAPQQAQTGGITSSSSNGSTILSNQINQSQYLLNRFIAPPLHENENVQIETNRADRSQCVYSVLLSTLSELDVTQISSDTDDPDSEEINAKKDKDADAKSGNEIASVNASENVNSTDEKANDVVSAQAPNVQVVVGGGGQHPPSQQQPPQQQRVVVPKQKSPPASGGASSKPSLGVLGGTDVKNRKTIGTQTAPTVANKNRELKSTPSSVCSNRSDNSSDSR